jgi:hypothetical protein
MLIIKNVEDVEGVEAKIGVRSQKIKKNIGQRKG